MISSNAIWHNATGTREGRKFQNTHKSLALWFTGLSCIGKSTLAHAVEEKSHQRNFRTFILDGDNVRHGLCGDPGFNEADKQENNRRVGEIAELFIEAGTITLTTFISPFQESRKNSRKSHRSSRNTQNSKF